MADEMYSQYKESVLARLVDNLWKTKGTAESAFSDESIRLLAEHDAEIPQRLALLPLLLTWYRKEVQHTENSQANYKEKLLLPIYTTLDRARTNDLLGRAGTVNWLFILGELGESKYYDKELVVRILKKWYRCFLPEEYLLAFKAEPNIKLFINAATSDQSFWSDPKAVFYAHIINEIASSRSLPVIPHDIIHWQIGKSLYN